MSGTSAVRVKICGLTTPEAAEAAATADYVGFVFFPPSPRYVTPAHAAALARSSGSATRVGLFVEPTDDDVARVLAILNLDILQLVADPARAASLRTRFGLPVWRALGVHGPDSLPNAMQGADALLLDAPAPAGATRPGGNAATFDWTALRHWHAPGPWLLAGGLHPGNVAAAIQATGAPAVDVSSGVESRPGVKDPARIAAFLAAARSPA